ncbi:MAG TPA: hypothetical protein ENK93_03035 [Campylobacteraceae bacterium]|nr:hypothetical protein [Campylobacteraceae bacterium]HHD83831.1 hypothetical protein [Campylobacteraceae bacterium]
MKREHETNPSVSPLVLKQCEAIIEKELENLQKLYRALVVIEEMELYKEQFEDFTAYCHERWGIPDSVIEKTEQIINLTRKEKQ